MKESNSKFWPDGSPKRHSGRSKRERAQAYRRQEEDAFEQNGHPFREVKFGDQPLDSEEIYSYLELLTGKK